MTWAELLTVLWQVAGAPQLSGPWDGAWYAGGANFALSAGLVREDALLPQQDMTRRTWPWSSTALPSLWVPRP